MSGTPIQPHDNPTDATPIVASPADVALAAFVAAALADGRSELSNLPQTDSIQLLIDALRALGVRITVEPARLRAHVEGCSGHIPEGQVELDCARSDAVAGLCAAVCCLADGRYRLEGRRDRARPLGQLLAALESVGAQIRYESEPGCLPLTICARGLRGGAVRFGASANVGALSALLLVAPYARDDVFVQVDKGAVQQAGLRATLRVMDTFGVAVIERQMTHFIVEAPQRYHGRGFAVA